MTQTVNYSWAEIENMCVDLVMKMYRDNWKPDYIVGLVRGGNVPATILSHLINVPAYSLKVSLRGDEVDAETNCWMAEDAYGYTSESSEPYNILVVDDINDTGATIDWVKNDWKSSCLPNDAKWDTIWGGNVRVATLVNNTASDVHVDYTAVTINKVIDSRWIVFPWEAVATIK